MKKEREKKTPREMAEERLYGPLPRGLFTLVGSGNGPTVTFDEIDDWIARGVKGMIVSEEKDGREK